jgi:dTDP-4-amino-4,6-dideoxygalactose transaminase
MPRHPPHRIDLDTAGFLRMLRRLPARDADAARARLLRVWAPAGDALAFLSVRSAFDATLTALGFPAGSEVLVSAVNIQDMATLLRLHGLVPVPLPLSPGGLLPSPGAVSRAVTPRTRGLLLAHLFGARAHVEPLFERARSLGLFVFEDAAQAFTTPGWRGSAGAGATYFSFGTIKTATAMGGALVRVPDAALRARMGEVEAAWPTQPDAAYARKVLRAAAFLALQTPAAYTAFAAACEALGTDAGAVVRQMTRGFGGLSDDALLAALRHRPCAAMLHVLADRLEGFRPARTEARAAWGRAVAAAVDVPGAAHPVHGHWLIPAQVRDAEAARAALHQAGIDASGPSNVVAIDDPEAAALIDHLVFVPAYPELPAPARTRLLEVLRAHAILPPHPRVPHPDGAPE